MSGFDTKVRAMNLYNKCKKEGLDDHCLDKFRGHHGPKVIVVQAPPAGSGGSIFGSLLNTVGKAMPYVMLAGGVAAGGYAIAKACSSSSDAQGANSSKAAMQTMQNAADSGDEKAITRAIEAGEANSKTLGGSIETNDAVAKQSKTDMDTVKGKMDTLEQTTIPDLKKGMDGLKSEKTQLEQELNKLDPKAEDYGTKKADLEAQIKQKETEIQNKQREIDAAGRQKEDFQQVYDKTKADFDAATKKLGELKPEKDKIDAEVARLREKLANIQNATKPNAATQASAASGATPVASSAGGATPAANSGLPPANQTMDQALNQVLGTEANADTKPNEDASTNAGTNVGTKDDSWAAYTKFIEKIENGKDENAEERGYAQQQAVRAELYTYIKDHPNAEYIKELKELANAK